MANIHDLTVNQTTTGVQKTVSLGQWGVGSKTFQSVGSTTAATGSATIAIEGSNNGVNWISLGNVNLTLGVTPTSQSLVYAYPWGYYRANVTAISGTGAKVSVFMAV